MSGDRGHYQELAAITNIVVEPDPAEAAIGSELRESNKLGNGVVIRQMGDELQAKLAGKDAHVPLH